MEQDNSYLRVRGQAAKARGCNPLIPSASLGGRLFISTTHLERNYTYILQKPINSHKNQLFRRNSL